MKSKCQHTIKARSLNATLPTIIIICHFYVTVGAGPPGRSRCTRTLQSVQECCAKPCHRTLVVALLRLKVLRVLRKLEYKLSRKDYMQINAFLNLVVVEREEYPHALQRKATGKATSEVVKEMAGWTRPGLTLGISSPASTRSSWRQSYIVMSCGNNARVKDLDITLDDPAGLRGWILMDSRI